MLENSECLPGSCCACRIWCRRFFCCFGRSRHFSRFEFSCCVCCRASFVLGCMTCPACDLRVSGLLDVCGTHSARGGPNRGPNNSHGGPNRGPNRGPNPSARVGFQCANLPKSQVWERPKTAILLLKNYWGHYSGHYSVHYSVPDWGPQEIIGSTGCFLGPHGNFWLPRACLVSPDSIPVTFPPTEFSI